MEKLRKNNALYNGALPCERHLFQKSDWLEKSDLSVDSSKYRPISLWPALWMEMRQDDCPVIVPKFAAFDVTKEGLLELIFENNSRGTTFNVNEPHKHFYKMYNSFRDKLYKDFPVNQRIKLSTRFNLIIPRPVKDQIKQLQDHKVFDTIIVVKEVEKWDVNITAVPQEPVRIDPLIIGIKGNISYFVAKFDTTTREEYIASEFTH